MATLNLSVNGPSIKSSYQAVVNSSLPASSSPTYAQWALFSVQAPLVNAFQDTSAKESVLKVQSTGDGELVDLVENFSEGRIQFAFVKVKDPNTGLAKSVLVAWCGDGVPERTKGYYTSHMAAVEKVLHGYHVQITARSDNDLVPQSIIQKVADASGAKYSTGTTSSAAPAAPPPTSINRVFTPTSTKGTGSVIASRPVHPRRGLADADEDDGWGADAPPVLRTQLEKVKPAYIPTKVNMSELVRSKAEDSENEGMQGRGGLPDGIVKGGYQPVGKVDISAIRAQAKSPQDDRPAPVKGAYEPVGKIDIAAIRAKSQRPGQAPLVTGETNTSQERIASLPKPKVTNRFGTSNNFNVTKPPVPAPLGVGTPSAPSSTSIGTTSRTFADSDGKTPAQLWAEKKTKEKGPEMTRTMPPSAIATTVTAQKSGSEWKSGYTGKSWAPVHVPTYEKNVPEGDTEPVTESGSTNEKTQSSSGGITELRDQFNIAQQIPTASNPYATAGTQQPTNALPVPVSILPRPDLPASPGPPPDVDEENHLDSHALTSAGNDGREHSPVRIAIPTARVTDTNLHAAEEIHQPPTIPLAEVERQLPSEDQLAPDAEAYIVSRGAAITAADQGTASLGSAKSAVIQYDYEKAEDNEIDLESGEYVVDIEMVDEDWWLGTNSKGERGLFPCNYVELEAGMEGGPTVSNPALAVTEPEKSASDPSPMPTATALFDYEAAEDNELSFPEGAQVINLEFPDEDWWFGSYNGITGLFPANYVQLDS